MYTKKNKLIPMMIFTIGCGISQASVVYKCSDGQDSMGYFNENQANLTCQKTNLGNVKNMAAISSPDRARLAIESIKVQDVIDDDYEKIEKAKNSALVDIGVLKVKITEEEDKLKSVNTILSNVGEEDADKDRLKAIKDEHVKNIDKYKKQIADLEKLLKKPSIELKKSAVKPENKKEQSVTAENGKLPKNVPQYTPATTERYVPSNNGQIVRVSDMPVNVLVNSDDFKNKKSDYLDDDLDVQQKIKKAEEYISQLRLQEEEDKKKKIKNELTLKLESLMVDNQKQKDDNDKLLVDVEKNKDKLMTYQKRYNLLMEQRSVLWKQIGESSDLNSDKAKRDINDRKV